MRVVIHGKISLRFIEPSCLYCLFITTKTLSHQEIYFDVLTLSDYFFQRSCSTISFLIHKKPYFRFMKTGLESLKVIEIASVLAGPSVGMFFAEMGAKVIKLENKKTGGDVTRSWKLPEENQTSTISAYFASINWHKEYHFVDFEENEDQKKVIELIRDADVLILNFKKGDAEKFGLDYSKIHVLNPRLIYAEISGFGENSDRVAYDLILQAESGFMSMNGTEDSGPVKMPVALIDILAGHQLKEGILVGLLQRQNTGQGCRVHVSLFDSAIASLANQASNWLMAGKNPERIGSKHPNIAPYGELFTTKEGKIITLAIGSDRHFKKLCESLELAELITTSDFISNQSRVKNRKKLAEILSKKISLISSDVLIKKLNHELVPVAIIKDLKEVFQNPETSKLILEELIDGQLTRRVKSVAFTIS